MVVVHAESDRQYRQITHQGRGYTSAGEAWSQPRNGPALHVTAYRTVLWSAGQKNKRERRSALRSSVWSSSRCALSGDVRRCGEDFIPLSQGDVRWSGHLSREDLHELSDDRPLPDTARSGHHHCIDIGAMKSTGQIARERGGMPGHHKQQRHIHHLQTNHSKACHHRRQQLRRNSLKTSGAEQTGQVGGEKKSGWINGQGRRGSTPARPLSRSLDLPHDDITAADRRRFTLVDFHAHCSLAVCSCDRFFVY